MVIDFNGQKIYLRRVPMARLSMSVRGVRVTVSAPKRCTITEIKEFIKKNEGFLAKHIRVKEELNGAEVEAFCEHARLLLAHYSSVMGLKYNKVVFKEVDGYWGKCNYKTGTIYLNTRLLTRPAGCLNYVIVHELAHLTVHNHSAELYALIERYVPDYKAIRRTLKRK